MIITNLTNFINLFFISASIYCYLCSQNGIHVLCCDFKDGHRQALNDKIMTYWDLVVSTEDEV
jgi:hypothetical protein